MSRALRRLSSRLGVLACACVVSAVPCASVIATASCTGQECNPSITSYGCPSADVEPGAACCFGSMVLLNGAWSWQSSPDDASWVDFPAMGTVNLYLGAFTDARPDPAGSCTLIAPAPSQGGLENPDPYANPPNDAGSEFTCASGSEGQFTASGADWVQVQNATCSPWVARFVIGFDAPDGGGPLKHGPCWK